MSLGSTFEFLEVFEEFIEVGMVPIGIHLS